MPKVAVILTSYNHAPYLEKAIQSLLAQTFQDYEAVAIDDASQDESPAILQRYADRLQVVLHSYNQGTYACLNEGIAQTSAPYLAILNSDDLWRPTKLEKQVDLLERHPQIGLVHTGFIFIDAEDRQIPGNPIYVEFLPNPQGDLLAELVINNRLIASSVMFRRACLERVGLFAECLFGLGDWDMWLRIAEHYEIGWIPEPLTLYRVHGQNAMYDRRMVRDSIWVREERIRKRLPELLKRDGLRLRKALALSLAALGFLYTVNGSPVQARAALKDSLRLHPWRIKTYLRFMVTFLPKPLRERIY